MGNNKKKKTILQKIKKFLVNGKPMSQIVHWTIIGGVSGIMFINIVRADEIINKTI